MMTEFHHLITLNINITFLITITLNISDILSFLLKCDQLLAIKITFLRVNPQRNDKTIHESKLSKCNDWKNLLIL